jgi:hypothetical protein
VFASVYAAMGAHRAALVVLWTDLLFLVSLAALKRGKSPASCGDLLCLSGWATLTALAFMQGGWFAPSLMWYSVLPVAAALTGGVFRGIVWTLIPLASICIVALTSALGWTFPQELTPAQLSILGFSVLAGLLVCQSFMACIRVGVEQRALAALQITEGKLAETRSHLAQLKASYGFSLDDWTRLKREKAALEQALRLRIEGGEFIDDEDDLLDEEDDLDRSDPRTASP